MERYRLFWYFHDGYIPLDTFYNANSIEEALAQVRWAYPSVDRRSYYLEKADMKLII